MCLAVPAQIIKLLGDDTADIEYLGNRRDVSTALVPDAKEGDWVLVHAGYALEIIDEQYAQESLTLWREMSDELATAEKLPQSSDS